MWEGGVDRRIILRWILNNVKVWTRFTCFTVCLTADSYAHDEEHKCSIKGGDSQLVKKGLYSMELIS